MPETYQPGQRRKVFGDNHRITENRYAWVISETGKWMILVGADMGHGTDVVLFNPRPGKVTDVTINLTNLTRPELDALRELFNTAFEWAETVVDQRDKEAQDAWDQGDDSHTRNYRPLPTVVYRKRPEREHSSGVRQRPDAVLEGGVGERPDHPGGVRGAGDELAEPHSEPGQSEDDGTSTD